MSNNLNIKTSINLHDPFISKNANKLINKCLTSGWVSSSGNYIKQFETNFSKLFDIKYSTATSNGTSALHLSLLSLNVEENDEVIVPNVTFIATINPISYLNVKPIFMDCDDFLNIDSLKTIEFINKNTEIRSIKRKSGKSIYLSVNKKTNKPIPAIIITHNYGNAVDLEDILKVCKEKKISIIEDAAESLGTRYISNKFKNKYTGTLGTLGCFSFNGNKILTTGAGGMILTNKINLAKKTKYLSLQAKDDPYRYIHKNVGYNYGMSNIQAAFGIAQLRDINLIMNKKRKIRNIYLDLFSNNLNFEIMSTPSYASNNNWLNILKIKNYNDYNSLKLMNKLRLNGIHSRPIWYPMHLQIPYKNSQNYKIEKSKYFFNNHLCLPSGNNLNKKKIKKIFEIING